jgi:hypothetical protein
MKTSIVKLNYIFPSCMFNAHLRYSSLVSISLKLSSGWHPTAFTQWRVCTMLVLTWECLVDLQKHWNCYHQAFSIDLKVESTFRGEEDGLTCWCHAWHLAAGLPCLLYQGKCCPLNNATFGYSYIACNIACPCLEPVISIKGLKTCEHRETLGEGLKPTWLQIHC